MLLVFIVLVGSPTVFGRYLSDLTLPATLNDRRQQSTEAEYVTVAEKCLSSGKILYENRCHQLLTEGPCGYGQWLVLDDRWDGDGGGGGGGGQRWHDQDERTSTEPTAKCARRRCSESDVYWPRDGFCYDVDTARRRRLCPGAGTVLDTDEFGDGRCACADRDGEVPGVRLSGHRRHLDEDDQDEYGEDGEDAEDDEDARPCYAAYTRGPCRRGHAITPFALGYGNCTVDRCVDKRRWSQSLQQQFQQQFQQQQQQFQQQQFHQQRLQQFHQQQLQQFRDSTPLAPWIDGLCYELGTRGPCADQEKFSVARGDVMRPTCVTAAALQLDLFSDKRTTEAPVPAGSASFSQEEPPPCKTDHRGQCVEGVDVPILDPADVFREQLLESARRHAQRNKERKRKRTPPRKN